MSQSEKLREVAVKFGGGKGTNNEKARTLEINLYDTVKDRLLPQLQQNFPNRVFVLEKKLYKNDIAKNLGELNWKPESKNPYISPDGAVLSMIHDDIKYPICICEAKQQGTNDKREEEGKKPQSKGNAIERAFKNFSELKSYCTPFPFFPYYMFLSGCDFKSGSSIVDRLDGLTHYKERNVAHTFHPDNNGSISVASVYMRDEPMWTQDEMYDTIYPESVKVVEYIFDMEKSKGKNFSANNATGKRKKSDFYETPYSLTRKFLDVETFDKSLTVCEPACGAGAISTILKERWQDGLVSAYDVETNFLSETGNYDYIVTNPPFSLAQEFILKAKTVVNNKFALLLPLSYLHGKKRFDEIYSDKEYPLKKVHVFTRYPMLGDKLREDGKYNTGMMVYAWFVWEKGYTDEPTISWIDNNDDVLSKKDMDTSQTVIEETSLTKFFL